MNRHNLRQIPLQDRTPRVVVIFPILFFCLMFGWPALAADTTLSWNTFMGSTVDDSGNAVTVDKNGNVYVVGTSRATWGAPVSAHTGGSYDAFVAKLNSTGVLQWNTFLGSTALDYGETIAVDGTGNVYVSGKSDGAWGSPLNPHSGGSDAFAAKLSSSGVLQWNTFLGSVSHDSSHAITIDENSNIYLTGESWASWGSPVSAFGENIDAFAVKLNNSGVLQWNTFLGATGGVGYGVAVDSSGNVYLVGNSNNTWGSPVNAFAGIIDVFTAKLNGGGVLQWNTFLGSTGYDDGKAIALDGNGNVYVAGSSNATWGSPVLTYSGNGDAFAAKLNNSGILQWNTFLGSAGGDSGYGIAMDGVGNAYVVGTSSFSWGSPVYNYLASGDAFAAKLDDNGVLLWNTFLGSYGIDHGYACSTDESGNAYVVGLTYGTWGSPINAFAGANDAFAAKLTADSKFCWLMFFPAINNQK